MTVALDTIPTPESALSRLDARWRLAALVWAVGVTAALRTVPASMTALAAVLVLALLARIPGEWFLRRIGGMAPFLVFFVLLVPFCVRDPEPVASWGPFTLSQRGLILAAAILLKALTIVTLVMVILTTAPLHATLHAAHRLRVPGLVIQLALLTYRYIFLVSSELARLRVALRVRGFRNRPSLHSYRTIAHVAGTLLVRSHERAERVAQAMRCRGFDGRFRSLTTFQTRPADVIAFLILVTSAAALLAWDVSLRS